MFIDFMRRPRLVEIFMVSYVPQRFGTGWFLVAPDVIVGDAQKMFAAKLPNRGREHLLDRFAIKTMCSGTFIRRNLATWSSSPGNLVARLVYLTFVFDVYPRKIMGWAIDQQRTTASIVDAVM